MNALPPNLTEEKYEKAVVHGKLASKAYDFDDWMVARFGMAFFSGIDDIKHQAFDTPDYKRVGGGGNWIDWWGGGDQGLDYTLFEHKKTKDVVLAFRGTEPLSFEDWIEDAEQVLGHSEQYKAAIKLAKETSARIDKQNRKNKTKVQLTFAGHSLGGGLANAAALATGREAFAFDAAGISNESLKELGLDKTYEDNISNFNVKGCFVSDWNGKMDDSTLGTIAGIVCKQYGNIYWLEGIGERSRLLPGGMLSLFGVLQADVEAKAETYLAHAWHVFVFQLEHKAFEAFEPTTRLEDVGTGEPVAKKAKLATPSRKTVRA
jgi:hypothetical protein